MKGNFLESMNDLLASFTTNPGLDINDNLASCQRSSTKKSDLGTTSKQICWLGFNLDKTQQKHQSLPVKYSFVSSQTDNCTDRKASDEDSLKYSFVSSQTDNCTDSKASEEDSGDLNRNMSELDLINYNEKTEGKVVR